MKGKYLITVISSVFTAAAVQAQTSVTVYGVMDTGIEYLSHAGTNGSGAAYRISPGNSAGSRWGLRGKENLGGGLSAIFTLEGGINTDTGTSAQGGRMFGRQAYVGITGTWGQITLGRQSNLILDLFVPIDPTRYATYGVLSHDAQLAGRADNVVKYTGNFGDLTVTGLYSAGYDTTIPNSSEVPGAPRVGQEMSAGGSYTIGKLGMAVAYDQRRGTSMATASNVERRYVAGLIYSNGPLTLVGGYRYLQGALSGPGVTSNLYWLGGSYAVAPAFVVRAGVYRTDQRHSQNDAMSYAVQLVYSASKRTDLFVTADYLANKGASNLGVVIGTTVAPGVSQTGVVMGVKHIF